MVNSFRRYFGAVSVAVLLLAAAFAFLNLQGTSSPPPAILDPDFTMWTEVENITQPMVWSLQSNTSPGQLVTDRTNISGRDALRLSVYKNSTSQRETFVSLSETLDGARLARLMNSTIGLWVYKEACNCDSEPFSDYSELLSVQVNDGIRQVSFMFTDQLEGNLTFLGHRVVFLPTPSGQWTYRQMDIGHEYSLADWPMPSALTFSLYFEIGSKSARRWHTAYISNVTTNSVVSYAVATGESSSFDFRGYYQTFKLRENLAISE